MSHGLIYGNRAQSKDTDACIRYPDKAEETFHSVVRASESPQFIRSHPHGKKVDHGPQQYQYATPHEGMLKRSDEFCSVTRVEDARNAT